MNPLFRRRMNPLLASLAAISFSPVADDELRRRRENTQPVPKFSGPFPKLTPQPVSIVELSVQVPRVYERYEKELRSLASTWPPEPKQNRIQAVKKLR